MNKNYIIIGFLIIFIFLCFTEKKNLKGGNINKPQVKSNEEIVVEPAKMAVEQTKMAIEPAKMAVEQTEMAVEPAKMEVEQTEIAIEPAKIEVEQTEIAEEQTEMVEEKSKKFLNKPYSMDMLPFKRKSTIEDRNKNKVLNLIEEFNKRDIKIKNMSLKDKKTYYDNEFKDISKFENILNKARETLDNSEDIYYINYMRLSLLQYELGNLYGLLEKEKKNMKNMEGYNENDTFKVLNNGNICENENDFNMSLNEAECKEMSKKFGFEPMSLDESAPYKKCVLWEAGDKKWLYYNNTNKNDVKLKASEREICKLNETSNIK